MVSEREDLVETFFAHILRRPRDEDEDEDEDEKREGEGEGEERDERGRTRESALWVRAAAHRGTFYLFRCLRGVKAAAGGMSCSIVLYASKIPRPKSQWLLGHRQPLRRNQQLREAPPLKCYSAALDEGIAA